MVIFAIIVLKLGYFPLYNKRPSTGLKLPFEGFNRSVQSWNFANSFPTQQRCFPPSFSLRNWFWAIVGASYRGSSFCKIADFEGSFWVSNFGSLILTSFWNLTPNISTLPCLKIHFRNWNLAEIVDMASGTIRRSFSLINCGWRSQWAVLVPVDGFML